MTKDIVDQYNSARLMPAPAQMLKEAIDEITRLRAENEKLREALKQISAIENNLGGGDWDEIEEARNIAAAAIREGERDD